MEYKGKKIKFVHKPIFADFVNFGILGILGLFVSAKHYFLAPLNTAFHQAPFAWVHWRRKKLLRTIL